MQYLTYFANRIDIGRSRDRSTSESSSFVLPRQSRLKRTKLLSDKVLPHETLGDIHGRDLFTDNPISVDFSLRKENGLTSLDVRLQSFA